MRQRLKKKLDDAKQKAALKATKSGQEKLKEEEAEKKRKRLANFKGRIGPAPKVSKEEKLKQKLRQKIKAKYSKELPSKEVAQAVFTSPLKGKSNANTRTGKAQRDIGTPGSVRPVSPKTSGKRAAAAAGNIKQRPQEFESGPAGKKKKKATKGKEVDQHEEANNAQNVPSGRGGSGVGSSVGDNSSGVGNNLSGIGDYDQEDPRDRALAAQFKVPDEVISDELFQSLAASPLVAIAAQIGSYKHIQRKILKGKLIRKQPSDDLIRKICALVRQGNLPETAARAFGVRSPLFRTWITQGYEALQREDYKDQFCKFLLALDAADAQDETTDIALIKKRINNWQALSWLRSRKTPQKWGATMQVTADLGQMAPKVDETHMIPDEFSGEVLRILIESNALPHPVAHLDSVVDTVAESVGLEAAESLDSFEDTLQSPESAG